MMARARSEEEDEEEDDEEEEDEVDKAEADEAVADKSRIVMATSVSLGGGGGISDSLCSV